MFLHSFCFYLPLPILFCSAQTLLFIRPSPPPPCAALLRSFTLCSLPSSLRTPLPCIRFSCGIWGWGHQSPKDCSEITERELVQKTHIIFSQYRVTHTHTHAHTRPTPPGFDRKSWRGFHLGLYEKIRQRYLFALGLLNEIHFWEKYVFFAAFESDGST